MLVLIALSVNLLGRLAARCAQPAPALIAIRRMTDPLLEVRHLRVEFPPRGAARCSRSTTSPSTSRPARSSAWSANPGAGKSLTGAAIIGLLDPPGRIAAGEIRLDGRRIDNLPYDEMRKMRGRTIGAIFQDPLTSLNPLYTIGRQLIETIQTHLPVSAAEARSARHRAAAGNRHPRGRAAHRPVPAPVLRRHAPARGDRAGAGGASRS